MIKKFIFTPIFLVALCCFQVQCLPNPDETRTVEQMIESRGFKLEIHYAITVDGYILTIQRVVNQNSSVERKRPVILQHGILSSSYAFVENSEGLGTENTNTSYGGQKVSNNLAFALAIFGYDVWLGNSRGNLYGRNHTTLDPNGKKFWEFTYGEMAKYDLPAIINYVRNKTENASVGLVAFSQGSLCTLLMLSEMPEYSDFLSSIILMAPIVTGENNKSPIILLARNQLLMELLYMRGGEFEPSFELMTSLAPTVCETAAFMCTNFIFFLCGFDQEQMNTTRLPVYVSHTPTTTSNWNLVHYGQGVTSRNLRKFDYGPVENLKRYNSIYPPYYDLTRIKNNTNTCIALISSLNDWLGDQKEVDYIREKLKDKVKADCIVEFDKWNHIDYLWGINASLYVNLKVITILETCKCEQQLMQQQQQANGVGVKLLSEEV